MQSGGTTDKLAVAPIDTDHVVAWSKLDAITFAVVICHARTIGVAKAIRTTKSGDRGDANDDGNALFENSSVLGGGGEGESAGAQSEDNAKRKKAHVENNNKILLGKIGR